MKQLGIFSLVILAILTSFAISNAAVAVCTGPKLIFTKADGADWNLPENQDCITANVCLTRGANKGQFNSVSETEFVRKTIAYQITVGLAQVANDMWLISDVPILNNNPLCLV